MERRDEQMEQTRGSASRKEKDKIYRLWIVADHKAGQQSGSFFVLFFNQNSWNGVFLLFSLMSN